MSTRIGITEAELPGSNGEVFLVAWPWSNDPAHLTAELADAVSAATGGLPNVLVASGPGGNRTFHGAPKHAAAAAMLNFDAARWRFIEVDHNPPGGSYRRLLAA
jgi:hypothetical protein